MGMGESGTSTKASKTSNAPEQQQAVSPVPHGAGGGGAAAPSAAAAAAAAAAYPEWAAAFQAYYGSGCQPPHAYFPSSVASGPPQPHPYMWGAQHMMPPPYGSPAPPPPYGAIYPHGGVFGHPNMPPGSHPFAPYGMPSPGAAAAAMAVPAGVEADGVKAEAAEDGSPMKRSKGSLGSKGSDVAKGNCSANGALSQSAAESGSDGSSEGSEDENTNSGAARKRILEIAGGAVDGAQDYWSGSTRGGVRSGSKRSSATSSGIVPSTPAGNASMGSLLGRDGTAPETWLQDEREVKRQRRKQSNRESARRSRLRKQAECEELGTRVDTLTVENMALRTELNRLAEECKKLTAENSSLQEKLQKSRGHERGDCRHDEDGEGSQLEMQIGQPDGTHTLRTGGAVKKSASPRMQVVRNNDEGSCDSTGKVTLPMDSESRPEAVDAR